MKITSQSLETISSIIEKIVARYLSGRTLTTVLPPLSVITNAQTSVD